ncbi:MAG: UDP-N-acetylmuramoyl-L-alanine--D-glutamate ligase [Candidatus Aminicenantes bacterium]|jgi:UDP-N-acetylmuramoylalanine--D-glutamate ligase
MKLEGKKVLVVGLGKTGEALCQFLINRKASVKISEKKSLEELEINPSSLAELGVAIEAGGHNPLSFLESDLIIPSPGVPMLPEMEAAKANGIPILSEIELAFRFIKGQIVGITGTNGKSTTASLTHKILKDSGADVYLAGNIGTPLISFANASQDSHVYVTELSSFQLEHISLFHAAVAVFLNFSPDHLDWHRTYENYYAAKKKLIVSQRNGETAVLNRDDPSVWVLAETARSQILAFSRTEDIKRGCLFRGDWIFLKDKKEEKLMKASDIPLLGTHNQENVMASALVGLLFSVPLSRIRKSISDFPGLEHRLEKVLILDGIEYYNDSKATNVDATIKSIRSFGRDILLILGGRDKGGDFNKLRKPIQERVKKVFLIGEARERIRKALEGTAPLAEVSSLKEAVRESFSSAAPGDVVLLAPACTSFDMFRNFEERGKIFKREVHSLKDKIRNAQR